MHVVVLCGPPCAGKTTLARSLAQPDDVVLDYDDIARACGSPAQWRHPERWRSMAEQEMQACMAHVASSTAPGTAYVLRLAPRPSTRASLAAMLDATVYVVDPGQAQCRAWAVGRPSGTLSAIGRWYREYRPWEGDHDPSELGLAGR